MIRTHEAKTDTNLPIIYAHIFILFAMIVILIVGLLITIPFKGYGTLFNLHTPPTRINGCINNLLTGIINMYGVDGNENFFFVSTKKFFFPLLSKVESICFNFEHFKENSKCSPKGFQFVLHAQRI